MSEPTEPTQPRTSEGAAQSPQDPAVRGLDPHTSSVQPAATQPLPASPAAPGAPGGPVVPGGPVAPGGYAAPGGPHPKPPGLWRQATSTTGGMIAVIVAGCLAALMVLGLVGVVGLVAVRAIGHHGHATRVERLADSGALPPGQQRKLDRFQQGPSPRQGDGMGKGMGGGMGPLMRGALGVGAVQHGEFTVQQNGADTVMTLQRGDVTKVDSTSVTVKSTDNFTATYSIGADTRGQTANLQVGDTVLVVAQKTGGKAVLIAGGRHG